MVSGASMRNRGGEDGRARHVPEGRAKRICWFGAAREAGYVVGWLTTGT